MDGARAAGREQVNGIAVALGFEELPDRADLHELRGFRFHFFDIVEKLQRFRIALGQQFFEIALESEMPAVEHERIDVAPDFGQIRDVAHAAVEIGRGGIGMIGAHLGAARSVLGCLAAGGLGGGDRLAFAEDVRRQDLLARRRVHHFVQEAQAGHGVLGVERRRAVAGTDLRLGEFFRQRRAAHQQRNVDAVVFEIAAVITIWCALFTSSPESPMASG